MTIVPCPVPRSRHSERAGEVCGRPVTAFVAPGEGRCGYHATARERTRALAARRAVREAFELRDVEPTAEELEDVEETPAPASGVRPGIAQGFDVERFVSTDLDEN